MPGETPQPEIPGFVLVRELGRGGHATVWLATRQRTGKNFAVKCPSSGGIERMDGPDLPETESPMLREVGLLSRLDHEHLVKVHGTVQLAGAFDGALGLVMDYAGGGSLGQLVSSRGHLTVGETVTILTPIAQALSYLHRQGLTHSDVAPGNVLFTAQGKPLLADLGLSRMLGDATGIPDAGTPGFSDPAPSAEGRPELEPERDTYALAALGWYCLTGSAPDVADKRPPLTLLVPEVPAALSAALEAGLHPDRQQRPTAAELAVAVYRSAAAMPVDLSNSVHETVIPDLITRRATSNREGACRTMLRRMRIPLRRRQRNPARSPLTRRSRDSAPGRRRFGPAALGHGAMGRGLLGRGVLGLGVLVALGTAILWWTAEEGTEAGNPGQGPTSAPASAGRPAEKPLPDHGSENSDGPAASAEPPPGIIERIRGEDPVEALRALSEARDAAFSTGRPDLLEHVNVEGSAAAAADRKIADGLEGAGLVLAGFSSTLLSIQAENSPVPDRASLAVTVETSAYEERDAAGKAMRSVPPGKRQELKVVLVRVSGAWRISEILASEILDKH
ncbi:MULTISPECIES: serine/threonine-protein kinase [Arthrobacter]|nr:MULTISPECIES: serine/threonine-protein kinase [Arthrobacter]MBT8159390.1 serine/threonine protein kinase [Arthrobacter sp. GN70]